MDCLACYVFFEAMVIIQVVSLLWDLRGTQGLLELLPYGFGVRFLLAYALHSFLVFSFLLFGIIINVDWSAQSLFIFGFFFIFLRLLVFLNLELRYVSNILNHLRRTAQEPRTSTNGLNSFLLILFKLLILKSLHLFVVLFLTSALPLALPLPTLYLLEITLVNIF